MAPLKTKLIFQGQIFHFHDYGGENVLGGGFQPIWKKN